MSERLPNIGRATVFRTVKLLHELDIVCRVPLEDGGVRYEHSRSGRHHHHLICSECGSVTEFSDPTLDAAIEQNATSAGFELDSHSAELYAAAPPASPPPRLVSPLSERSCYHPAVLSPYRILDLSDERGLLCGHILADLGADVVLVEPPGGSPARSVPPLLDNAPEGERSSSGRYARNRRSIELDLDSAEGQDEFRRLAASADILIESADPGVMAARGLGADDLAEVNPGLVYVSITAFGQDGPKANYRATDLIVAAASGTLTSPATPMRRPFV